MAAHSYKTRKNCQLISKVTDHIWVWGGGDGEADDNSISIKHVWFNHRRLRSVVFVSLVRSKVRYTLMCVVYSFISPLPTKNEISRDVQGLH